MFANHLVLKDHDCKIKNGAVIGELAAKPVYICNNVWCDANVSTLKGLQLAIVLLCSWCGCGA